MSRRARYSFIRIFCFFSLFIGTVILQAKGEPAKMVLSSPAFLHQAVIPVTYTAQGDNVSPPLSWDHAPEDTASFVLICEDPDAVGGTFDHWILYNIPPSFTQLPEDLSELPDGIYSAANSLGNKKYDGPKPPSGTHRYIFTLYALDTQLDLPNEARKETVLRAMQAHILAQARLIGLYKMKKI